MEIGDALVRGTIWPSLLAWVAAEWARGVSRGMEPAGRRAWTVGALAALGHTAAAFHFRHGWSQRAALTETARQTAAITGLDWGGGLYVNYLFLAVWTADLSIDRVLFAEINLAATLVGSHFCLGIGRLIDRAGSRLVLTVVSLCLGVVVVAMSGTHGVWPLLALITLTRGFGQSALSVASLALVGKWFSRRLNLAMGAYALVMSIGFMAAFPAVGAAVQASGWRVAWAGVGLALVLVLAPLSWLLVRSTPEGVGLEVDGGGGPVAHTAAAAGASLEEALATPAFWVFALAASVYGLAASGIALFNESILAERGFDPSTYYRTLVVTALTALLLARYPRPPGERSARR